MLSLFSFYQEMVRTLKMSLNYKRKKYTEISATFPSPRKAFPTENNSVHGLLTQTTTV